MCSQLLQAILNGARCKLPYVPAFLVQILEIECRAINILNAAVKTTAWEGADGIITEGVSTTSNNDGVGFKGSFVHSLLYSTKKLAKLAIFIRGIHEAWTRNPNNTALRTLIHSYGDVQVRRVTSLLILPV